MGTTSPQFERAVEILADGKWHSYREVVSKMAATIPPGIGARRAERNRRHMAVRNAYGTIAERRDPKTSVELARIGALAMARQTLNGNPKHFEIEPRGERRAGVERRVRLVSNRGNGGT